MTEPVHCYTPACSTTKESFEFLRDNIPGSKFIGQIQPMRGLDRCTLLFEADDGQVYGLSHAEPVYAAVPKMSARSGGATKTSAIKLMADELNPRSLDRFIGARVQSVTYAAGIELGGKSRNAMCLQFGSAEGLIAMVGKFAVLRKTTPDEMAKAKNDK